MNAYLFVSKCVTAFFDFSTSTWNHDFPQAISSNYTQKQIISYWRRDVSLRYLHTTKLLYSRALVHWYNYVLSVRTTIL